MDDFTDATALEPIDAGHFRTTLREDWALWGPAGGYLCPLALRAVGETTAFKRPVSFAVQYLAVGRFEAADLRVTSHRAGRRTEALRVDMVQGDRMLLTANVWVTGEENSGLRHDYTAPMTFSDPASLPTFADVRPDLEEHHPFFARFEQRLVRLPPQPGDLEPQEPEIPSMFRFIPMATSADAFVDAARPMLLLDTCSWVANHPAHPDGETAKWIAPNLDFYFRFHRPTTPHEWLALRSRAELAEDGLIASGGEIRDRDGRLLVSGATQLLCTPRPARFS